MDLQFPLPHLNNIKEMVLLGVQQVDIKIFHCILYFKHFIYSGYGIASIRCDGTDVFATYNATKVAREYVLKNNKPIVFEAMAYRIGHHSTSDDSSAYRSAAELEVWNTVEHPISKLKNYMIKKNWWNEEEENSYVKSIRKQVLSQISLSEKIPKPDWREMFYDVYYNMPQNLKSVLLIKFSEFRMY